MTPDEPESPGPPDDPEDHAKSRADLQAVLRSTRKKERKRRHRWRRRSLYALSLIVVLAAIGAGGPLRVRQLPLQPDQEGPRQAPGRRSRAPGKPFNLLLVGSDSRAFVSNATQENAFGDEANAGGQRSAT